MAWNDIKSNEFITTGTSKADERHGLLLDIAKVVLNLVVWRISTGVREGPESADFRLHRHHGPGQVQDLQPIIKNMVNLKDILEGYLVVRHHSEEKLEDGQHPEQDSKLLSTWSVQEPYSRMANVMEQSNVVKGDGMADIDGHWHGDSGLQVQLRPPE
ncbi:hypothetical protein GGX14DRAFT_389129 [Mycena pura]|uniref:Uncharacterized protein n=1 Tax=Mycena pura TaxID=153505 RepID=A0AAD6VUI4_9AGAR|nr:hypothetical protein GGX14DRAFT_389129 [Mycena pura]